MTILLTWLIGGIIVLWLASLAIAMKVDAIDRRTREALRKLDCLLERRDGRDG